MDHEFITEFGRASVVDLSADNDRKELCFCHGGQIHAHLASEPSSASFDHAQIGDVVNYAPAIGVKEHHFFKSRALGLFHMGLYNRMPEKGSSILVNTRFTERLLRD